MRLLLFRPPTVSLPSKTKLLFYNRRSPSRYFDPTPAEPPVPIDLHPMTLQSWTFFFFSEASDAITSKESLCQRLFQHVRFSKILRILSYSYPYKGVHIGVLKGSFQANSLPFFYYEQNLALSKSLPKSHV